MKIANGSEMKNIDERTIEKTGIPGIVLMENAAKCVCDECVKYLQATSTHNVLIFCGAGNNGGDGFAVARILRNLNYNVNIFFTGKEENIMGDSLINYNIAKKLNINIETDLINLTEMLYKCDLIVDSIFGTGFSGAVKDKYKEIIDKINKTKKYIISVDIPSGVVSDTGDVKTTAVVANKTVVFQLLKIGNVLFPGCEHCGEIVLSNISIPKENIDEENIMVNMLTDEEAVKLLPKREKRSHKGSYGKVYVIGGSKNMMGAPIFVCKSAYKSGCGLVHGEFLKECTEELQAILPEVIINRVRGSGGTYSIKSLKDLKNISKGNVLILGPGMGCDSNTIEFVKALLPTVNIPVLIDADAINCIGSNLSLLRNSINTNIVITPHPLEFSRLTGDFVEDILKNMIDLAKEFSIKNNVVTVLKDAKTIIVSPKGEVYINTTGTPAMAKGGSGDVLSGVIGGLVAQGLDIFHASVLGCYIHGKAGELAEKEIGSYGVMPTELIDYIPKAISQL